MSTNSPDAMIGQIDEALALLRRARRPLLFCHRSPDGDTIGAALALAMALQTLGKDPAVICPDSLPPSLLFMPGIDRVRNVPPADGDLIITVDISDLGLLGDMQQDVRTLRDGRPLLNIDHHASDTRYGDINVVDITAASTSEIVYDLMTRLGLAFDKSVATALLTGIINDTHSFQNANTSERALATAASLVAHGAEPMTITYNLLLRRRPQAALLWGRTLATLSLADDGRVASAYALQHMLRECDADMTDLDGIVEFLRNIAGVDLAFLLKETSDGHFKASVRTTDRVDAVDLTAPFGGGGHRRAAGCDVTGTPDQARNALLTRYSELRDRDAAS